VLYIVAPNHPITEYPGARARVRDTIESGRLADDATGLEVVAGAVVQGVG
jgi:hypothetical protein